MARAYGHREPIAIFDRLLRSRRTLPSSSPGSTPCENILSASVDRRSRFPVRSPLPSKQFPRGARQPAKSASSAEATFPCRDRCADGPRGGTRRAGRTLRPNHSIWSAYTFGVDISTVAGRLRIILRADDGSQTFMTAAQNLAREVELRAREALGRILEPHVRAARRRREPLDPLRRAHRDVHYPWPIQAEDDATLQRRSRVIDVNDRARRAGDRLERPVDELLAAPA